MTFLAPLFLAGLAALAIPIVVHLTHRERRDPVPFPSLVFLRKVPFKTQRRQRLRHWALFALRAGAIVLFAGAFARPLLRHAPLAGGLTATAREVVVLLDRSASMGYGDRWTRARAAARDVIDGLGPDDRLTLVAFANRAVALNEPTDDPVRLRALLEDLAPGAGGTGYAGALRLARDLLERSERPRREVVVITDFQRTGWSGEGDVRLPAGVAVRAVSLGGAAENAAVAGVLLDRAPEAGGRVAVSARVRNASDADRAGLAVRLEVDGQTLQTVSVDVAARASSLARFAPVALPDRPTAAAVRLAGDALPADDAYRFLLRPIPRIRVLLIEHPSAPADETLFLRRVLEIGRDPALDVVRRTTSRLDADDLRNTDVVVLNDAPFPGGAAGERLLAFVRAGGGLFLAAGRRGGGLPAAWRDTIGRVGSEPVDRLADRGATMSVTAYDHPVFAPFASPRSGDFSATRFFRYRRLQPAGTAVALARLDDGAPALLSARSGEGRVLLWASDLGNAWNDLPVQPVFLPFVHQAVRYLARFVEPPAAYAAGQMLELTGLGLPEEDLVVETPAGERSALRRGEARAAVELADAGVYAIYPLGARPSDGVLAAVNPDPAESDLRALDPDELLAAVRPATEGTAAGTLRRSELTPAEREQRQAFWWLLLLAALVALTAESAVASRAARSRR